MATIDVSKAGNPLAALKKLKRTLDKQGGSATAKFSDRHVKPTEKRRKRKIAARKREEKKKINDAKNLLSTTRRYRNLSVKQILKKIYGA
ncbi:30S ribosomal protein S21 [Candidatus Synchoanobacter obligatus]|uniref:Small ribosomal subunit protein bS21 n=1 Tax=Candidatus Synchoanobacter obligatus TaxID=2919597 RepID=A0ABT1L3E0_9GAMM|nr:30S ribosomal protein S21 [Candidatus Synchoanobacter obligatus]MCP8351746.1 30S ribosomal protein S21 [Candidatus Synchoanobacter obligatus]